MSCATSGCSRRVVARGMCHPCYKRWHRTPAADGLVHRMPAEPIDRFWSHVQRAPGPDVCWTWTGSTNANGYPTFFPHRGRGPGRHPVLAHRWIYAYEHGPIPDGLHVDHVCGNRLCVRHLEAVTVQENNARRGARQRRRNACTCACTCGART